MKMNWRIIVVAVLIGIIAAIPHLQIDPAVSSAIVGGLGAVLAFLRPPISMPPGEEPKP